VHPLNIELRHLRSFVAVAEEAHFGRAAQRLHMAQPPLSRQIRQLETELGVLLFRRDPRGVELTAAGRALLPLARTALADVERAAALVRRVGRDEPPPLRVGYGWSAAFEVLPALGRAFRERHPELRFLAQEMWNTQLVAALGAGDLDVAVTLNPDVVPGLAYETIRVEPLVAVVPRGHALAGRPEAPLAALAGERLLLFPRDLAPRLYDSLVDACRRAGFEPLVAEESFHTSWDLGLAPEGAGVTLCPAAVAGAAPPGVAVVRLTPPAPSLPTTLLWHRDADDPAVAAFVAVARELAAAAGWLAPDRA
jgi:DNA-binding transcriptional LysR family regulator